MIKQVEFQRARRMYPPAHHHSGIAPVFTWKKD